MNGLERAKMAALVMKLIGNPDEFLKHLKIEFWPIKTDCGHETIEGRFVMSGPLVAALKEYVPHVQKTLEVQNPNS